MVDGKEPPSHRVGRTCPGGLRAFWARSRMLRIMR